MFDVAANHGLTQIATLRHRFPLRHEAVIGDAADRLLAEWCEHQKRSHLYWALGDIRWADPHMVNGFIHQGDPEGWFPRFSAWGPKARAIGDDLEEAWGALD
jgi:hypothetical protein